jgi:hypothetical protein
MSRGDVELTACRAYSAATGVALKDVPDGLTGDW